jgi:hypothetical protein
MSEFPPFSRHPGRPSNGEEKECIEKAGQKNITKRIGG